MEDDREFGPSYKSLFLGACIVIGGSFGWWLTNLVSTIDSVRQRVTELETRVSKLEWRQSGKVNNEPEPNMVHRP